MTHEQLILSTVKLIVKLGKENFTIIQGAKEVSTQKVGWIKFYDFYHK